MNELEQSIVSILTAAKGSGTTTRLSVIEMLLSRLDFLKGLIAGLDKTAVLELVSKLYDDYIAPLDIPGVPNFILEPQIDSALKALVLAIVEKIIDKAKADEA
jgi:hypothetical protein